MFLSGTRISKPLFIHCADLIGLSLIGLIALPLAFFLPVVMKWVVIGRYKPGRYPLWGSYYFRWWLAKTTSRPLLCVCRNSFDAYISEAYGCEGWKGLLISARIIYKFLTLLVLEIEQA